MPPRSRNSTYYQGDLRHDLIAAAHRLIAERGADALSLREVARRVGVSHAAPAHHFGDRTGLLTAVATEGFAGLRQAVATARAGHTGPAALIAAGVAYVAYGSANWAVFDLMFRSGVVRADDPAYLAAALAARAELVEAVTAAQTMGWAPRRSPDDVVLICWALAHGLAGLAAVGAIENSPSAIEPLVGATVAALGTDI